MAHFYHDTLTRPDYFNFANDVVDYWAETQPKLRAMRWASQDGLVIRDLDFAHFSRQSHRFATVLRQHGLVRGDVLLVILPRIVQWWELAIACIRMGVILCPATTLLVETDIEFRCNAARAKAFIGDTTSVEKMLKVLPSSPSVELVFHVRSDGHQDRVPSGAVDLLLALGSCSTDAVYPAIQSRASDPCLIYFTSGTSGPPKMVQHNSISYPLAHTLTGKHWLCLKPGQLYWNLSEQGWAKAAWSLFGAWNCGSALFVFDDRGAFDANNVIDSLHNHPITTLCAPPTAYRQLVLANHQQSLRSKPPQALEHCTGAGEPLDETTMAEWERLTGMTIKDGYGQTETVLLCGNFPTFTSRPGSMGKPTPGVVLSVLQDDLGEAPVGQEGALAVQIGTGNSMDFFGVFDGYWTPDGGLVRKSVPVPGKCGSSWYFTGDRAYRDEQGYLWFVGRADDVINSAGYRIGPFEVESTLKQHRAVVESAVIAAPDAARGEVVKALVVLTEEYASRASPELALDLQNFCKAKAAPYKYPRQIEFVRMQDLPKTISGKIKRAELKKVAWANWHQARSKL